MDDGAVLELIGLICENKGLPKDPARDRRLKDDYSKKYEQLKFRPLFLQMYIEAWIDNGCIAIEYQNYKALLEVVVHREQERFLQIFGNDVSVVNALIILLIRASVSDGESMPELSRAYPKEWNTVRSFVTSHSLGGKQTDESLQTLFREAEHGFAQNDILRPLYPDLIKEFMFIYYLDDESAASLSAELWKTCPIEYNTFLSRCIVDFQNEPLLIKLVRDATEDYSNLNAMQVRWALLQDKIIHTTDEGGIFLKMVTDEHTYWSSVPVNRDNEAIVLRGLYYSVFQYFAWSLEKESRAAIEQVIQFSCSEELKPIKATYLTEFIHYLVDRKSIPFAEQFVRPTSKLIEEIKDKKCRNECRLTLQREIMVCLAYRKELGKARQLHCKIKKKIDWSVEKQVEQYAYICFSGANQCYRKMQWKDMLTFADWIQDLAEECGKGRKRIYFNDKTHYYYLHSKLMRAETVTINAFLKDVGYYGIQLIDSLIDEIESNEMFSDLSGLLIGAKTLKIGFDESVSDAEARDVLSEADALLQKYPNNALLVAKSIDLWKTAYESKFHKDVPKELIERAYALVLRFPSDEDVLFEFFEMLEKSSEASNWLKYTKNKAVVCGLIQHGMTEHLIPR